MHDEERWLRAYPDNDESPFHPPVQRLSSENLESPGSSLKALRGTGFDEGCQRQRDTWYILVLSERLGHRAH
jgi:hypothetical protein